MPGGAKMWRILSRRADRMGGPGTFETVAAVRVHRVRSRDHGPISLPRRASNHPAHRLRSPAAGLGGGAIACTTRRRESVPDKAAGIVRGAAGEAAPRRRCDSDGACRAVVADRLASHPHGREAGYAHPMASKGFPVVLALDVKASWATAIAGRPAAADRGNGGRESN